MILTIAIIIIAIVAIFLVVDMDGDGVSNIFEMSSGVSFLNSDSDSDGTNAGTEAIIHSEVGNTNWNPFDYFTVFNDNLYFFLYGLTYDGLYRTDGTESGTVLVKTGGAFHITKSINSLFFTSPGELYMSDGTSAGTELLMDINPGGNSYPDNLTAIDDTLYFQADDGTHGRELWIAKPYIIESNFTYSPSNPTNNDIIQFTESSVVNYSNISSYWWDFGDGYYSDLQNPYHQYLTPGTYNVCLTITNEMDGQDTICKTINIALANQAPVADAGGPYNGYIGAPVIFDASGSTDINNDILNYRWDYDNDGSWDTSYSTDPTASHIWNSEHTGTVKVEVFDGEYSDIATTPVTINNAEVLYAAS